MPETIDPPDAAFEALFNAYAQMIRLYCGRRLDRQAVDDAVADVFAVAWKKIDRAPTDDSVLPWLYGIAYRVVLHQWRRGGRLGRLQSKTEQVRHDTTPDTAEVVLEHEEYRLVREAASRLQPIDQEILRLTMWEEISLRDAGLALGISPNAAKQRAHRARKKLVQEYRRLSGETLASGRAHEKGGIS